MDIRLDRHTVDGVRRRHPARRPDRSRRAGAVAGLAAVLAAALSVALPVSGLHGAGTALGATCPGGATSKTTSTGGVCEAKVTADGTWTVPTDIDEIDIVVVGGGGGGGGSSMGNFGQSYAGAGGGGGVVLFRTAEAVVPGEVLTVTIGTGGAGGAAATYPTVGGNGADGSTTTVVSTSLGTLSAAGGTAGDGGSETLPPAQVGGDSGRDVGGSQSSTSGGDSFKHTSDLGTAVQGGGGAGANADGSDGIGTTGAKGAGGAGGAGYTPATGRFDLNVTAYGGGGGGGGARFFSPGGAGGVGGGGDGGSTEQDISIYAGQNGAANTGGGGGGSSHGGQGGQGGPGGAGGSGVVVIRFALPKADQSALTITSTSGTFGTPLTLTTSGGDGTGAVTYVVDSGPCTVVAGVLTATAAGDCYVTATKAGDGDYNPVSSTSTKITIAKKTQSALTLTTSAGTVGTPVTLATSGGDGTGAVTYIVDSGPCAVVGGVLLPTGAGDCYVTATKAGDSEYQSVSSSSSKVTISKGTQPTVSVSTTDGTYGTPLTLATSGGAGTGAVTWVVDSGPCTVTGGVLRATGAGDCYVTATKAADGAWDAASSSSTKVEIGKADPVCTVVSYSVIFDGNEHTAAGTCVGVPGDGALTGLDLSKTAHTNVGDYAADAWSFTDTSGNYEDESGTVDNRIRKAIPVCEIEPYLVAYDGTAYTATGTCKGVDDAALTGLDLTGTTHTDAGTYPTDAWTFTDTTGNYRDRSGTVRNVIQKADQAALTIDQTTGTTGVPLPLTTSGGSGTGTVTWRVISGGCTIDGSNRLRAVAPGPCLIEAVKAGDANHRATSVAGSVTFTGDGISSILVELISDEREFNQVPGQTLTFRYRVTNDGGVPLPGPVVVDDPEADVICPDVSTVGNFDGILDPGEVIECVGTHVVDAEDIQAGAIDRSVGVSVGDTDVSAGSESEFRIRVAPTFFVLVDRSGSQASAARRTVDEYNRLIAGWRSSSQLGRVTVRLFNSAGIEQLFANREIRNVAKMSVRILAPTGDTPLYDTVARTIRQLRASGPIGQVHVAVITDGVDTASTRETKASVAKLIRSVERTLGWRFVYPEASVAAFRAGPADADVTRVR